MKRPLTIDPGQDLEVNDYVYIKCRVDREAGSTGDVRLEVLPRPGYSEFGAREVNAIFVRRLRFRWAALLIDWLCR